MIPTASFVGKPGRDATTHFLLMNSMVIPLKRRKIKPTGSLEAGRPKPSVRAVKEY